jgi:hypothetical protein
VNAVYASHRATVANEQETLGHRERVDVLSRTKSSRAGYSETFVVFEYFGQLTNDPFFERQWPCIWRYDSLSFVIDYWFKSRFGTGRHSFSFLKPN